MPHKSERNYVLQRLEGMLQERWNKKNLRLMRYKYSALEECRDMELLVLYIQLLSTRYLSRSPHRVSSIAFDVFLADLEDDGDSSWLTNVEFTKKYRVSREFFWTLVEKVKNHYVFRKGARGPDQAPVELQVMVFLYYVGCEGSSASNSNGRFVFRIGEGTVQLYRERVCTAICSLGEEVLNWPDAQERRQIATRIYLNYNNAFHSCVGMMDGTLFPLAFAPETDDAPDYSGRKHAYSMSTLVICDDQRRITYYLAGWAGSSHDNRIFRNSDLFQNPDEYFSDSEYIIGDSAYSNTPFCVTTFKKLPNAVLTEHQEIFNTAISRPRVVSEHTIGILKGRFPWLRHIRMKITNDPLSIPKILMVIDSCVILHNLLIKANAPIEDEWLDIERLDRLGLEDVPEINAPIGEGALNDTRRTRLLRHIVENVSLY